MLNFTVKGRMTEAEILQGATIAARQEVVTQPVIIFSKKVDEMCEMLPEAVVFDGDAGELLSMLNAFRTKPVSPNYIVITTDKAVLGLTLFLRAYIILTFVPNSLTEFR